MTKICNLDDVIRLRNVIESTKSYDGLDFGAGGVLEIHLTMSLDKISSELDKIDLKYRKSANKSFEIEIDTMEIAFYKDKSTFCDKVSEKNFGLEGKNIFIWEFDNSYLVYRDFSRRAAMAERTEFGDFILNVLQYRDLLEVFIDEENLLVEFDRIKHPHNELFIVSKGDEKLLIRLAYKKVVHELYSKRFEPIDHDKFIQRLENEEWVACFKNTVCAFFDHQSESKKTFLWLYENFAYLFANTEKSYLLYVSKFSFDKISKEFRKDQGQYFNSLNDYQNKLSGQLISIPLTIGAALLSDNFVANNGDARGSLVFLISAYVIFVMGTIGFVLADLIRLRRQIKKEKAHFQTVYEGIYTDFKKDFEFLLRKSRLMLVFAVFLLFLFIGVLIVVWFEPGSQQ